MTRRRPGVRVVFLVVAVLASCASVAFAERPKVAVLGLEVVGAVDQRVTIIAEQLTQGLRERPRRGNGQYQLAANSDRELIEEKLIKSCEDEAPACMSEIGERVGADLLIYGNLAKTGDALSITLHLLDVENQAKTQDLTVDLAADVTPDQIREAAKKAYTDLTGDVASMGGTIVIHANVPAGNVFVDDVQKDTLTNGTTTLVLTEGRYRIAVESEGRSRKEIEVKIVDDETVTEQLDLETKIAKSAGGGRSGVWKPAFIATAVGTVALTAVSIYGLTSSRSLAKDINAARPGCPAATEDCRLTNRDCGNGAIDDAAFNKACSRYSLHAWSFVGAAVLGAATIGTGYMAFIHSSSTETPRQVAVTPGVSPDGGGATLRVTW
jgi:hypothetical protein